MVHSSPPFVDPPDAACFIALQAEECDLSDRSADATTGLKTTYEGDPYDHYEKRLPLSTQVMSPRSKV